MKKLSLLLVPILILFFSSCKSDRFDSGELITEERVMDDSYSEIKIDGSFDVYLVDDTGFDIKIECGEKKLEYLDTYTIGDKLYVVERDNHIADDKSTKVWINHDYFTSIEIDGSGDIEGVLSPSEFLNILIDGSGDVDLSCDVEDIVDISIDGSGDVDLSGEAQELYITIDGSGDVDTKFMPVNECSIFIDGSGDVIVNVLEYLYVQIYGSGDVRYLGDPIVEVSDNGSGDVSPY